MESHTHISPVHMIATLLAVLAVFGTFHLMTLSAEDSRWGRALMALGF